MSEQYPSISIGHDDMLIINVEICVQLPPHYQNALCGQYGIYMLANGRQYIYKYFSHQYSKFLRSNTYLYDVINTCHNT